ncbi:23226_t:CDS:2, partial [Dentiscutata erythropus]
DYLVQEVLDERNTMDEKKQEHSNELLFTEHFYQDEGTIWFKKSWMKG